MIDVSASPPTPTPDSPVAEGSWAATLPSETLPRPGSPAARLAEILTRRFADHVLPVWLHSAEPTPTDRTPLAFVLVALAMAIMLRSYEGIRHDSVLYMGQVLYHLHPEIFSQDFFFGAGSQDHYTIFTPLLAFLGQALGWRFVPVLALVVCQLGFFWTLFLLLRQMLTPLLSLLGIALVYASSYYGGGLVFEYAEPFLTARSVAEPFCLLALLLALRERLWWAFLILWPALLVHPLIGLPCMAVLLLLWMQARPLRFALLLFIPLAFALGMAGWHPFKVLLDTYDNEWWNAFQGVTPFVFPQRWAPMQWTTAGFDLVVLGFASWLAPQSIARLARAVLLVAVAGIAVATVSGDMLHLKLLTQAQVWRAQWLAQLLAMALYPWLLWTFRRRGVCAWAGAALLLYGLEFSSDMLGWQALVAGSICLVFAWHYTLRTQIARWVGGAVVIVISWAAIVDVSFANYLRARTAIEPQTLARAIQHDLLTPTHALLAVLCLVLVWSRLPRAGTVLAALLLLGACASWDQRNDWQIYIDEHLDGPTPFATLIPPTAQVYWGWELSANWLVLQRPAYFNHHQGAGNLFSRPAALEYSRRKPTVAPLEVITGLCATGLAGVIKRPDCIPPARQLEAVCTATPAPEYIILREDVDHLYRAEWSFSKASQTEQQYREGGHYYLYTCTQFATQVRLKHMLSPDTPAASSGASHLGKAGKQAS